MSLVNLIVNFTPTLPLSSLSNVKIKKFNKQNNYVNSVVYNLDLPDFINGDAIEILHRFKNTLQLQK